MSEFNPNDYADDARYERREREAAAEREAEQDELRAQERIIEAQFIDPDDRLPEPIRAALAGLVRGTRRVA